MADITHAGKLTEYLFESNSFGIDRIDLKMLDILRDDARIPLSELSKRCRISKQTATYRISKMLRNRTIKSFNTKINYPQIGYSIYYLFLQTRFIDDEKSFIDELSRIPGCTTIMKSITQYSYNLKIITKDIYSTMQDIEKFFNRKKLITSHFIVQRLEKTRNDSGLDEKDKAILREMSTDCRQSSIDISKKTGLSYDVVHNRIKYMVKDKTIEKFQTIMDFESKGFMYYSILLKLSDDSLEKINEFEEMLKSDCRVVERFRCLGEYNYVFEIVDRDYVSINNKLNWIRSKYYTLIKSTQIVPIENHYFYKAML